VVGFLQAWALTSKACCRHATCTPSRVRQCCRWCSEQNDRGVQAAGCH